MAKSTTFRTGHGFQFANCKRLPEDNGNDHYTGVGIDVPTIGDLFHLTFQSLLEMKSPQVSWLFNWDIYQPLAESFTHHLPIIYPSFSRATLTSSSVARRTMRKSSKPSASRRSAGGAEGANGGVSELVKKG